MKRAGQVSVWGLLVLGGAWLALPAAAAGEACEAGCNQKATGVMKQCMATCPDGKDPKRKQEYTACATRCSEKFDERFSECSKGCAKDTPQYDTHPKPKPRNQRSAY